VIGVADTPRLQRDIHGLMIDRVDHRCDLLNSFAIRPEGNRTADRSSMARGAWPPARDIGLALRSTLREPTIEPHRGSLCDTISLTRTPPQILGNASLSASSGGTTHSLKLTALRVWRTPTKSEDRLCQQRRMPDNAVRGGEPSDNEVNRYRSDTPLQVADLFNGVFNFSPPDSLPDVQSGLV